MNSDDLTSGADEQQQVLTVSQLTAIIKDTLENTFPHVWISGELSDISRPQSGHVYFTLKDAQAQVRGVMWRSVASRLRFDLEDGLDVICQGSIDVYPPRGSYQLVVRQIEPRGVGALQLALKRLQEKLGAEGLFDASHKKSLPRFPRRIAVVTSPTGAAIRDFVEVLRRRWRGVDVLIIPARVQGDGATEEIVEGIRTANRIKPTPDVLVVGRGGGSLEDLWCFNEEAVVRAIFASAVPVVSAIGHEIDVTLSDLVSDARALTPTEAAELVVPSGDELSDRLRQIRLRLVASLRARAAQARSRLDALAQRRVLRRPEERLHELSRRVDELELRAAQAIRGYGGRSRERLAGLSSRLEALSPLSVLARGYSLTERARDGQIVRDAAQLSVGERVLLRFAQGRAIGIVEDVSAQSLESNQTATKSRDSSPDKGD
jgi:exodeoxyribonuclease VII large subunit